MANFLIRSDPRLKLIITLVILGVVALVRVPLPLDAAIESRWDMRQILHICILGLLSIFLFVGIILIPNRWRFIKRVSWFLPFIIATFVFSLLSTPGKIAPVLWGRITYEGLYKGALLGGKAFLGIGYALIFALSTPAGEIAKALDWITLNKLKIGETLLIAIKFSELLQNGRKNRTNFVTTLKYTIEEIVKTYKGIKI